MNMYIRKKVDKGASTKQNGQIKSLHSFSFYNYFDEKHVGYGNILAFNCDTFSPNASTPFFPIQGHDVIIFVREGDLKLDVKGRKHLLYERHDAVLIRPGLEGLDVSIINHSSHNNLEIYMLYFKSSRSEEPLVQHVSFAGGHGLKSIILPSMVSHGHMSLKPDDVKVFYLHEDMGSEFVYPKGSDRKVWVEVIKGQLELNKNFWEERLVSLNAGDAIGLSEKFEKLVFEAQTGVEAIIVDMPSKSGVE